MYSGRFEALLGKLPLFNQDWAKTQFIWGLHSRVAGLVTIAGPTDLHLEIRKAEEIEMARTLASRGQTGQKMQNQNRGRGRVQRGHVQLNAVQPVSPGQQAEHPNAAIAVFCSIVSPRHQCSEEKPMPNAIIVVGTAIFIGSAHLHRRQDNEVEDVACGRGHYKARRVNDVEEYVVGDNKVPKAIQRMLL